MNKKIKIIEIFNIISKRDYKALPLNIEVDGKKYNWDTSEHFYNREDRDSEDLLELSTVYDTVTFLDMIAEVLDGSVEDNTEEIEEYKGESFEQLGYEVGKIIEELLKEVDENITREKANAYNVTITDSYAITLRDELNNLQGKHDVLIKLKNRICESWEE